MADGLELNAGSGGATLLTDDTGASGHAQVVKLAISTDGSATLIPADATNGIDVDVTRVGGTVTVDGSGVTQPVSGTVTAELSAADNAVLDSIDTSTQNIDDHASRLTTSAGPAAPGAATATTAFQVGGVYNATPPTFEDTEQGALQLDSSGRVLANVGASALPTGAATSAKQDTVIGHLDGVEALLGTIDGDTSTLAGAVADGQVQVDVVAALPAGTNLVGRVSASGETSTVYNGTTALTPKFAAIAAATSGDNTLVAAVSGKKIRVLAIAVVFGAATDAYFTSAAAGTVIFGGSTNKMKFAANSGLVLPYNEVGWFENSSTNQALVLNMSSTGPASGGLTYVEV